MTVAPTLKDFRVLCARAGSLLALTMVAGALLAAGASPAAAQATLKAVKERGAVRCGVSEGLPGFSAKDAKGEWSGLDVDLCRALAAAIFDDPSKVAFTPLSTENRFVALASGTIDVLSRNTTWTLTREAGLGLQFAAVTYYDGQGFLVRKNRGATTASQLGGAKVCVESNTTTELNLEDHFRANNIQYDKLALPTAEETIKAYDAGRCDVLTGDIATLHSERLLMTAPDEHLVLPDVISKEPLGPAVREGDDQWLNLVKWTHYAMVNAEELGVTQATLPQALASDRAELKRLLGGYAALGEALGLANDWVVRIIRHVGNYGEVFERNLGSGSRLGIPRGRNQLWFNGGLQYGPPMR